MMCVEDEFVVISLDVLDNKTEQESCCNYSGRQIKRSLIFLTDGQFAGKMLQIKMMTETCCWLCLRGLTNHWNKNNFRVIQSPMDTIESCGGGGARCRIADVFTGLK